MESSSSLAVGRSRSLVGQQRAFADQLQDAIDAAREHLLGLQAADGHWCGELEGDTIVESEPLLALFYLGKGRDARSRKLAEHIRRQQLPLGGWATYPGGPAEVSASVKAYFVLKLMGDAPDAPHMMKARRTILDLGGIEACNSFTKIYLAVFGQCRWAECPAVPPELILLPEWFPFSIYRVSSWSRAIMVPLSILWALKPSRPVAETEAIPELRRGAPAKALGSWTLTQRLWSAFFHGVDVALKAIEGLRLTPWRRRALARAEAWVLARLDHSDGLGAILPPIVNTIIAFRCLGYSLDDPRLAGQLEELDKLIVEEEETARIQPCTSPIWDTALAAQALLETGTAEDDPALQRAARWLLAKEARLPGDYRRSAPGAGPGGWYFEYRNEFYPDTDDTAAVLNALSRIRLSVPAEAEALQEALRRGLRFQLAMQNDDGGWGAFDKGCDDEFLTFVPFADHNAMIDPSCEDITGRSLDALSRLDVGAHQDAVRKAVSFLRSRQQPDGTWYGRWGCNYLYGTWLAITGLERVGEDLGVERYQRTAEWLYARQNEDGGWGELPLSYDDPRQKGIGPSTASQTSWALMTLFALGHTETSGVRRGLAWLLRTQGEGGSWEDRHWTGTGFPKVFYLKYHLYATYFPLLALGIYRRASAVSASALDLEEAVGA